MKNVVTVLRTLSVNVSTGTVPFVLLGTKELLVKKVKIKTKISLHYGVCYL